jgi:hypothetical protein
VRVPRIPWVCVCGGGGNARTHARMRGRACRLTCPLLPGVNGLHVKAAPASAKIQKLLHTADVLIIHFVSTTTSHEGGGVSTKKTRE